MDRKITQTVERVFSSTLILQTVTWYIEVFPNNIYLLNFWLTQQSPYFEDSSGHISLLCEIHT